MSSPVEHEPQALEIESLKKIYKGGVEALKGLTLTVKKGDFYALLGPNGAGKSTTIGIITSLVNKSSGRVKIFGYDLDSQLELAKSQVGLVPQEFNFNQFETVKQILVQQAGYYGVPKDLANERAKEHLSRLGLWEKRHQSARNLSGGMKRRLMIARALMHNPQLLILDEPTAGVDIELRRSMWEFLRELNEQGTTIILTTHYLEEAEMLCRHIGIIDNGVLIQNTTMRQLLGQLTKETFILDLAKPSFAPELSGFDSHMVDSTTLEVTVNKEANLNDVFSQLSEQGITVASMRNKANRLEELFVTMVENGRSAQ